MGVMTPGFLDLEFFSLPHPSSFPFSVVSWPGLVCTWPWKLLELTHCSWGIGTHRTERV